MQYLGSVLAKMSHAPEEVLFTDCALSDKAVNGLANGLFLCQLSHSALRKLSFAGNLLKEDVNVREQRDLLCTFVTPRKFFRSLL